MRVAKALLRPAFKLNAQNKLFQMYGNSDEASRVIGDALKETMQNNLNQDEKVWIDKIELLRKKLDSSDTEISIVDFGAGKPKLSLANEDMNKGRVIVRTIGKVSRGASKPYFWSVLLFKLIRKFKPSSCLELGTCLGISTAFQAAALKLNGTGKIVTLEGASTLASLAKGNFYALGLDNVGIVVGRFRDTLNDVLNENRGVDFVFIDGHHDEKATIEYFEQIKPFVSERALLVFDDITWSEGMKRAWRTIKADEQVKVSVGLRQIGICAIDSVIEGRKEYSIPII